MDKESSRPFWQEFMLRILWLLGVKPDFVEQITIHLWAGKLPEITITRSVAYDGETKQVLDVFQASSWKAAEKGPEQSWEEFCEEMKKPRRLK